MNTMENCVSLFCSHHGNNRKYKPRYYLANALFNIEETPITYELDDQELFEHKQFHSTGFCYSDENVAKMNSTEMEEYEDYEEEYRDFLEYHEEEYRDFVLFEGGLECVLVPYMPDGAQPMSYKKMGVRYDRIAMLSPQAQKYARTLLTPAKKVKESISLTIITDGVKLVDKQTRNLFETFDMLRGYRDVNEYFDYAKQLPPHFNDHLRNLTISFPTVPPVPTRFQIDDSESWEKLPEGEIRALGIDSPILFNDETWTNLGWDVSRELYQFNITKRLVTFHCPYGHNHRPLVVDDIIQAVKGAHERGIKELDIADLEKYCN